MNLATEIRLPRVRVRPAKIACVRVYTRDGAKPERQPEPVGVDRPKLFDEWDQDALSLAWQRLCRKEGHFPGYDYQAPQPPGIKGTGLAKPILAAQKRCLEEARQPIETDQIAARLGRATSSVYSTCSRLMDRGLMERSETMPGVPAIWTTTEAGLTAIRTGMMPAVDSKNAAIRLRYQGLRKKRMAQILHLLAIEDKRDADIRAILHLHAGGYWDSLCAGLLIAGHVTRLHIGGTLALSITDAGRAAHAAAEYGVAVFGDEAAQ